MRTALAIFTTLITLGAVVPAAVGAGVSPVGPILNGDLELAYTPPSVTSQLDGTPLDACIGIGHQALYGTETYQADAESAIPEPQADGYAPPVSAPVVDPENPASAPGGVAAAVEDFDAAAYASATANQAGADTAAWEENASASAERAAGRNATYQAELLSGYGHCVWSDEEGIDYVWLAPAARAKQPVHWSFDIRNPSVEFGYYFDADPFDREARVTAGHGSSQNFWQAYPSPFQAFTPNGDALRFQVESGDVPPAARVQLSLSAYPLEHQGERVLDYDCFLTFTRDVLQPDAEGWIRADPVDARFTAGDEVCAGLKAQWDAGDADARRSVLGRTRIIQVSFWAWNTGASDVVLDDIQLDGATLLAEEAAAGNANAGGFLSQTG